MLTGRDIARRVEGGTQVRTSPLRSRLRLSGLTTSDDHALDVAFTCGIAALDTAVERQMLSEAFLSDRDTVSADDVAAHFSPALREAASRAIAKQQAEYWLSDASRPALLETLRTAAKPVAFHCGVELLPPFELSVESPTLQREKLEAMQRKLAERRAAGQAEHVQRAAELLKQFQSLRDATPGLSPGQILERVNPSDRGSMLETLLMATSSAAGEQSLWAVAGPNLVRVDPRAETPTIRIIPLPSDLGPLRSVQPGELQGQRGLLVGAQSGVMWVDPQRPQEARKFADRDVTSPLGFNSVVTTGDMIFATHAEAGVVAWRTSEDESGDAKPAFTIRPQGERPANATALDDRRILYSAGGNVFLADDEGRTSPVSTGDPAALIAVTADDVLIVRITGLVEQLDRRTFQRSAAAQRAGEITSAGLLPWLGSTRLLLATKDGPICCIGTDDPLVTQYASSHRGLRAVAAAADIVAAVSGDRQRLILWKSWDGRKPFAEVHLANVARHRVADVCFG
ncbi:MAG: hypothetical protein QOE14_2315 [Humisphaera sp.]|nr:hypothetical protein [Humisphaera sp.]